MLRSGIDGLIISSFCLSKDICSAVEHTRIPVVELEEHSHFHRTDCVQTSCTSGAYEIVEHLIKWGIRRSPLSPVLLHPIPHANEKNGYLRALEDYNIPVNPDYIIAENYANDFGYQAMQKLWNLPERPTAVFSANYTLCLGIYEAIYSLGIRIPEDLSVVSFD